MTCSRQFASLIVIALVGLAAAEITADEPKDKPQPKLVQAKKAKVQAIKPRRTFRSLLHKGQSVTLQRIREAPDSYRFQVRIVTEEQKKQVEDLVAAIRKEWEDYRIEEAALEKQMRETEDRVKHAELSEAREDLRKNYRRRRLPTDLQSARFHEIIEVGDDYVGFERDGVEAFHRLSSIHLIIRGVEIDQD